MKLKQRIEHILKHNVLVQTLYRFTMSAVFRVIGLFVRTDPTLVLMNGHGYKYNDSPRAIHRKMVELGLDKTYRIVWALHEPDAFDIPGRVETVKMDSLRYFVTALRAKYWVSCVNIERSLHFKKRATVYMNTWHGAIINLCGNAVGGRRDFHFEDVNYFCVNSEREGELFARDFNLLPSAVVRTGYPRNDELYAATPERVRELREAFSIPEGKRVILYAPTWRDSEDGGASYTLTPPVDFARWERELSDEYVVLLRTHPYTTEAMNVTFGDFLRDVTDYEEVNHLLIVADLLISDYSSINLDYAILEKPMLCFGYDYDAYKQTRGFYYDLEQTMPGGVVRDEDTLLERIRTMDTDAACRAAKEYKQTYMQYGDGQAALACLRLLFPDIPDPIDEPQGELVCPPQIC